MPANADTEAFDTFRAPTHASLQCTRKRAPDVCLISLCLGRAIDAGAEEAISLALPISASRA
jgi:hypothetical protein